MEVSICRTCMSGCSGCCFVTVRDSVVLAIGVFRRHSEFTHNSAVIPKWACQNYWGGPGPPGPSPSYGPVECHFVYDLTALIVVWLVNQFVAPHCSWLIKSFFHSLIFNISSTKDHSLSCMEYNTLYISSLHLCRTWQGYLWTVRNGPALKRASLSFHTGLKQHVVLPEWPETNLVKWKLTCRWP